jgi:hypothetical protein
VEDAAVFVVADLADAPLSGDVGVRRRMQVAEIDFLRTNEAAQTAMAQNYVGLPY